MSGAAVASDRAIAAPGGSRPSNVWASLPDLLVEHAVYEQRQTGFELQELGGGLRLGRCSPAQRTFAT